MGSATHGSLAREELISFFDENSFGVILRRCFGSVRRHYH